MAKLDKIDSNVTGLRVAREASIGVLPASPVWIPLEPNEYGDFGGEVTTIARNPINPSRQRKKGVVVDQDAGAGYSTDLTQTNMPELLEGFFFAALRRKKEVAHAGATIAAVTGTDEYSLAGNIGAVSVAIQVGGSGHAEGDLVPLTGGTATEQAVLRVDTVSTGTITAATVISGGHYTATPSDPVAQGTSSGSGVSATFNVTWGEHVELEAGDLIRASGFADPANNGLKRVTGMTGNLVEVAETLVEEVAAPAAANLVQVGVQASAGDLDVDASGTFPTLTSTVLDFETLGLVPGEWIYIGGDAAGTAFDTAANNGFARVRAIAGDTLTLDKTEFPMVNETTSTETVQLFFGRVLKNELGAEIVRSTYQFERTLGAPDTDAPSEVQAEYVEGNVAGELTLNVPTAEKITLDLVFAGLRVATVDGPTALKTGTRPAITEADAFNTSSDVRRVKLARVLDDSAPDPLFAFVQELTLTINNNVTPNKAVGVLGAFEVTAGTFEVGGDITAYFADLAAVQAVLDNADVTFDMTVVKANSGITIDLPLITLGEGRPNVTQDEAITLPLNMMAATGAKVDPSLDHTALMVFWDYLPSAAE